MHPAAINAIIKHTCIQCGCAQMATGDRIILSFSDELTSCLAHAYYDPIDGGVGEITLSSAYWNCLATSQKVELIIHEVCHILADHLWRNVDAKPHGNEWKVLMKCAGINRPSACIEV